MKDKTVLITGATNGIGKVAALELARQGARVALVARNAQKGQTVLEEIKAATGNSNLDLFVADLSSMGDVRRLASEFKAKHSRLDVLVNNAGAFFADRQLTGEKLERTFALNHMSYFLLTNLLLDTLKGTPGARVVSVSSGAHAQGRWTPDNLQGERKYSGWQAYADSKLYNVLFTLALARRLTGSGVTANCLHPGFVKTGFADGNPGWISTVFGVLKNLAAISPERGADTMVYLASSPAVEGITGQYFENRQERRLSEASHDQATQERLWAESTRLAGL